MTPFFKKVLTPKNVPTRIGFLLIFISVVGINFLRAQDSISVRKNIQALTGIWLEHEKYASKKLEFDSLKAVSKLFPAPSIFNDSTGNPHLELIALQKQQYNSDKGLSIDGGYVENFAGGHGGEDVLYRRRAQAGIDWNILQSGLYGNKNQQTQLSNEARVEELRQLKHTSAGKELETYNTIIYAFNREKTFLLQERQNISNEKMEIISKLYSFHAIPYIDYLDGQQQQTDISAMYNLYAAYNIQMKTIIIDSLLPQLPLPVFDIDSEKMFAIAGQNNISDSINALLLENMRLENAAVNKMKLDLFVKYNYYDYGALSPLTSRSFASAGVQFSMPILLGRQTNENIYAAQQRIMSWEQTDVTNTRALTIANSLYEFRYKMKQYEGFFSKRREYVELLRIEHVKQQFGDLEFNPLTALTLLDMMMQVDIELIDLRQQMYLTMLDIYHELPGVPVSNYIKPWTPMSENLEQTKLDLSIYIWSTNSATYSANFITNFLVKNGIKKAIVSPGKTKESYARAKNLIDTLLSSGIHSELLIGENSLLKKKNPENYIDSILKAMSYPKIDAIHLDVEPHTFADWDTKKDSYLTDYLKMARAIKTYCISKNISLAISIPVFYPQTFLDEIYNIADEVYVMAYEQTDANKIVDKTKEERGISSDRTTIAIRTKDFVDRKTFDDFLFLLSDKIKQTNFAIHDFNSLVNLK